MNWESKKTHCPKGHEYTEENTIVDCSGIKKCRRCRRCRICRNESARKRNSKNKEYRVFYSKEYKIKNPDKIKLYDHISTIRKYGLSIETYNKMLKEQNGVCAVCKNTCKSGNRLSVDHNHETGKVRGLLCGKCNKALGLFGDDISLLENAITYLNNN